MDVALEIVVEGDRDREPLQAPAGAHRFEDVSRRDDAVAAAEMPQLPSERVVGDGRKNFPMRVPG